MRTRLGSRISKGRGVGIVIVVGVVTLGLLLGREVATKALGVEFVIKPGAHAKNDACFDEVKAPAMLYLSATKSGVGSPEHLGDWTNRGGDGRGGNLVSVDLPAPGPLVGEPTIIESHGIGGHFWMCPDPRCDGRRTFERVNDNTSRAWAATDGEPGATVRFKVEYVATTKVACGRLRSIAYRVWPHWPVV